MARAPSMLLATLASLVLLCGAYPEVAQAFWLADTSLFSGFVSEFPVNASHRELVSSLVPEAVASPAPIEQQQQQQQQKPQRQEHTPTESAKSAAPLDHGQCRCDADWLEAQADTWLNKRLASAHFAGQIRSLVSNSTGTASAPLGRRDAKLAAEQPAHHSAANHAPTSATNRWGSSGRGAKLANNKGGQRHASASRQHAVQQAALKLMVGERGEKGEQGPRGERGDRGERGERGERGPSGLISVKDREALFDLPAAHTQKAGQLSPPPPQPQPSKAAQSAGGEPAQAGVQSQSASPVDAAADGRALSGDRQLVFVESEQLLVISTASGWRPVQLLPALRDFRKTIVKFSLGSPGQRRNLMSSASGRGGARQRQQVADEENSIKGAHDELVDGLLVDDDDENEDDDEDDDDDDDDEEQENGIDLEEDADEDNDEKGAYSNELLVTRARAKGAAGKHVAKSASSEKRGPVLKGARVAAGGTNDELDEGSESDDDGQLDDDDTEKLGLSSPSANKARASKARPMARSALASALVEASIDNSITARSPTKLEPQQRPGGGREQSATSKSETPKLRIAALNEPFPGNVHGIRGADFECKRNAARANIKGSFRSFLAAGFQNLNEVVRHNVDKYPVVNLRDELIANSWHDLFKQPSRSRNPLSRIYSFDGRHVATDSNWPNKLIWHGAGNKAGRRDHTNNCAGWHSDSLSKFGLATPLHLPKAVQHQAAAASNKHHHHRRNLIDANSTLADNQAHQSAPYVFEVIEKYPCRMPLIVLCVETAGQIGPWSGNNDHDTSINGNSGTNNALPFK